MRAFLFVPSESELCCDRITDRETTPPLDAPDPILSQSDGRIV